MSIGDRVKRLREMHGFTQVALANEVPGLTQPRLSRIESELADADPETLELLALSLDVRSEFFVRDSSADIATQSPQLRSRSRLTRTAKASMIRWAETVLEEYRRMEAGRTSTIGIESMTGDDPRSAARSTRTRLGFDLDSPLPYLILAMERAGVTVLGIPSRQQALDAFSAWDQDGRPVIGLLEGSPPDRIRWNAAHELGHLILHRGVEKHPALEAEADEFAAELLTPLSALRSVMPKNPRLSHLTVIKTQWGVSVKSLVRRARELGAVDPDRALSLYKQMSARGWNRDEPGFVAEEKPRGFRKLVETHFSEPPDVTALAVHAAWSDSLARRILARHASKEELPFEAAGRTPQESNVVDFAVRRRLQPGGPNRA